MFYTSIPYLTPQKHTHTQKKEKKKKIITSLTNTNNLHGEVGDERVDRQEDAEGGLLRVESWVTDPAGDGGDGVTGNDEGLNVVRHDLEVLPDADREGQGGRRGGALHDLREEEEEGKN